MAEASSASNEHVARLGISSRSLDAVPSVEFTQPAIANLARAGSLIAAAWYTMCGCEVSWPLEPCRYDLLIRLPKGDVRRVQVKSSQVPVGDSWKVYLSTTSGGRRVYGIDEIDEFFIVTGNMEFYSIPIEAVVGRQAIHLAGYECYRVNGGMQVNDGDRRKTTAR